MPLTPPTTSAQPRAAVQGDVAMLCVSLELSRSTWLLTSLAPGSDKMSKHKIEGGDHCGLLELLRRLQNKAAKQLSAPVRIVTIQEAGFDGFWIDRLLQAEGIESHVVDPASVAVPRRRRRAQDRQNRRRAAVADAIGVASGRVQGMFHGGTAEP